MVPSALRIVTLCSCLAALAGCYAPEISACQVSCAEAGGECPEGTSCSGGYCNPPGVAASTCGMLADGGSGADAGPFVVPDDMVLIPDEGTFLMGCTPSDSNCGSDEMPRHPVRLSPYLIDITEVTVAAYAECVAATSCAEPTSADTPNYDPVLYGNWPVTGMNRQTAAVYCAWRDKRLPTEAEWEKAARGGTEGLLFPWGNQAPGCYDRAQYRVNTSCDTQLVPADVGSFPSGASGYGVMDMSGNVWEWVSDWNGDYPASEVMNPTGPDSEPAVTNSGIVRGAGYLTEFVDSLRSSNRHDVPPDTRSQTYGMRCVKDIE